MRSRVRAARIAALAALLLSCIEGWSQTADHRFEDVARVVAVGGVRGAADELRALLQDARLLDESGRWIGGEAHLVSVGDALGEGPASDGVVDLLREIEPQAAAAGGRVHVLLGEHELRLIVGDGDAGFAAGPEAEADRRWLRERPLAVAIDDTLFIHGGLPGTLAETKLAELNAQARSELADVLGARAALVEAGVVSRTAGWASVREQADRLVNDRSADAGLRDRAARLAGLAANGLLFSPRGPLHYERTAVCHPYTEQQVVEGVLAGLRVERAVLASAPTIGGPAESRMDGRVVLLDSGFRGPGEDGPAAALVIEGGRAAVSFRGGQRGEIVAQATRAWKRPYGLDDAGIEAFLATAEVIRIEDLSTGITKPRRLTLSDGTRQLRAVFKTLDTDPGLEASAWNRRGDRADRYQYDLAAYRLDRILDLHMVPPTVIRTVDGERGAVQYWVENAINERDRQKQDVPYDGACSPAAQYNLMNVFDILIHNEDRTLANVLHGRPEWKLWLIDHTRAFRATRSFPEYARDAEIELSPQLRAAVEGLTPEALEPLRPYLHERQLKAIVQRAERLLR